MRTPTGLAGRPTIRAGRLLRLLPFVVLRAGLGPSRSPAFREVASRGRWRASSQRRQIMRSCEITHDQEETMAKGQMKSNKEKRKPKKDDGDKKKK